MLLILKEKAKKKKRQRENGKTYLPERKAHDGASGENVHTRSKQTVHTSHTTSHLYITRVPNFHITDHSLWLQNQNNWKWKEKKLGLCFLVQPKKANNLKARNQCLAKPKIKARFNYLVLLFLKKVKFDSLVYLLVIRFDLVLLFCKSSIKFFIFLNEFNVVHFFLRASNIFKKCDLIWF